MKVILNSFSFRRSYPSGETDEERGFVFDCRSLPNPGRIEHFHGLSGLNQETYNWLMDEGSYFAFLNSVKQLVDLHLAYSQTREFPSVTFSFGCTGGQHRSVFMAEQLNDYLNQFYPQLKIELNHTESNYWLPSCSRVREW